MSAAGQVRDRATRGRLIEAATRLFAERGFRHVPVRDICAAAEANVAAVNYHFGGKMGLYREVIDSAAAVARESTALAIRAGQRLPPREQLRRYIEVLYARIATTDAERPGCLQQIIHREMAEPTGAVTTLVDRLLKGRFEYLQKVIGQLLDLPSTDTRVALAATAVHGLILMYRPTPLTVRLGKALHFRFTPADVSEHLVRFALAGVTAYARDPAGSPGRPRASRLPARRVSRTAETDAAGR